MYISLEFVLVAAIILWVVLLILFLRDRNKNSEVIVDVWEEREDTWQHMKTIKLQERAK